LVGSQRWSTPADTYRSSTRTTPVHPRVSTGRSNRQPTPKAGVEHADRQLDSPSGCEADMRRQRHKVRCGAKRLV
jgi:hypothetical protein